MVKHSRNVGVIIILCKVGFGLSLASAVICLIVDLIQKNNFASIISAVAILLSIVSFIISIVLLNALKYACKQGEKFEASQAYLLYKKPAYSPTPASVSAPSKTISDPVQPAKVSTAAPKIMAPVPETREESPAGSFEASLNSVFARKDWAQALKLLDDALAKGLITSEQYQNYLNRIGQ
jgi:hypothetical protein